MEWIPDYEVMGQLALGLFFSIVFLQSSLDKMVDWKGNQSWLKEHFSKSFLGDLVRPMLLIITIVEFSAGLISLVGVGCVIICSDSSCVYYGLLLSLLALLMLLLGQRIVKDYEGAQTIAIYFGIALLGLLFI